MSVSDLRKLEPELSWWPWEPRSCCLSPSLDSLEELKGLRVNRHGSENSMIQFKSKSALTSALRTGIDFQILFFPDPVTMFSIFFSHTSHPSSKNDINFAGENIQIHGNYIMKQLERGHTPLLIYPLSSSCLCTAQLRTRHICQRLWKELEPSFAKIPFRILAKISNVSV